MVRNWYILSTIFFNVLEIRYGIFPSQERYCSRLSGQRILINILRILDGNIHIRRRNITFPIFKADIIWFNTFESIYAQDLIFLDKTLWFPVLPTCEINLDIYFILYLSCTPHYIHVAFKKETKNLIAFQWDVAGAGRRE